MLPTEQARQRALQAYLVRAVLAAQNEVAPELLDLICVDSEAEQLGHDIGIRLRLKRATQNTAPNGHLRLTNV